MVWQKKKIAGRKRPAEQLLPQDRIEKVQKKDNGVKWRHIRGLEMSWETKTSKVDMKHMEEKMMPSQRRSNQAKKKSPQER